MNRKFQIRRQAKSKVMKTMQGNVQPRRLQTAEVAAAHSDSAAYIPASVAKNRFATVLENVSKGQEVFITKHNAPKAVVISVERFRSLSAATTSMLDRLTAEFDARLARMQTPKAQRAMEKAFNASPAELGKAAVKAARSRS